MSAKRTAKTAPASSSASPLTEELSGVLGRAKILVVDDTTANRIMLEHMLREQGVTDIVHAVNGKDALEKTLSLRPSLVLLDLMMPVMDGFEYCRTLRASPEEARAIPV